MMHEFGHALAIDHTRGFNQMRKGITPTVGGTIETVIVQADDAQIGRFLYPLGNTEAELLASAQRLRVSASLATNRLVRLDTGVVSKCPGLPVDVEMTIANRGNISLLGFTNEIVLGAMELRLLEIPGQSLAAETHRTTRHTANMRTLPEGVYAIKHIVDSDNVQPEPREHNNKVVHAGSLAVPPGCP